MTNKDTKSSETLSDQELEDVKGGLMAQIDGVIGKDQINMAKGSGKITKTDTLLSSGHQTGLHGADKQRD